MTALEATEAMAVMAEILHCAVLGGRTVEELYGLMGVDAAMFERLMRVGARAGMWNITPGRWVTLTDKGRVLATRKKNVLKAARVLEEVPHEDI